MFLKVEIPAARMLKGQPFQELIAVDASLKLPGLLSEPMVETGRFPNAFSPTGEMSRYFHFISRENGLAMNYIPEGKNARLMLGCYGDRSLLISSSRLSLSNDQSGLLVKPLSLERAARFSYLCFRGSDGEEMILRLNCVEAYENGCLGLYGSFLLPHCFLVGEVAWPNELDRRLSTADAPLEDESYVLTMDCVKGRFVVCVDINGFVIDSHVLLGMSAQRFEKRSFRCVEAWLA